MPKLPAHLTGNTPLLWLLTNSVAAPIANFAQFLTFGAIFMFTNGGYGGGTDEYQEGLLLVGIGGAITGVILALAQSLALFHTKVPKWIWVASTVVGLSLCNIGLFTVLWLVSEYAPTINYLIAMTLADNMGSQEMIVYCMLLLAGVAQGAIVGTLQWLVLRRSFEGSEQWIWVTSIGLAVWFVFPIISISNPLVRYLAIDADVLAVGTFVAASVLYVIITTLTIRVVIGRTHAAM